MSGRPICKTVSFAVKVFLHHISINNYVLEKFGVTKRATRSRKWKDRQYNGQKKKGQKDAQ